MPPPLRAVLARRLVRRLCEGSRGPALLNEREQSWLRGVVRQKAEKLQFLRPGACPRCNGSGYRGRIGIFELLEVTGAIADALRTGDSTAYSRATRSLCLGHDCCARHRRYHGLGHDMIAPACTGGRASVIPNPVERG